MTGELSDLYCSTDSQDCMGAEFRAEIERLRAALEAAPRPHPAMDVVVYCDWFFKTRIPALEPKP